MWFHTENVWFGIVLVFRKDSWTLSTWTWITNKWGTSWVNGFHVKQVYIQPLCQTANPQFLSFVKLRPHLRSELALTEISDPPLVCSRQEPLPPPPKNGEKEELDSRIYLFGSSWRMHRKEWCLTKKNSESRVSRVRKYGWGWVVLSYGHMFRTEATGTWTRYIDLCVLAGSWYVAVGDAAHGHYVWCKGVDDLNNWRWDYNGHSFVWACEKRSGSPPSDWATKWVLKNTKGRFQVLGSCMPFLEPLPCAPTKPGKDHTTSAQNCSCIDALHCILSVLRFATTAPRIPQKSYGFRHILGNIPLSVFSRALPLQRATYGLTLQYPSIYPSKAGPPRSHSIWESLQDLSTIFDTKNWDFRATHSKDFSPEGYN